MPNILITTSSFAENDPGLLDRIVKQGLDFILNPYGRKLTEDEISGLIEQCQPVGMIAGIEPLTRAVLERAKDLKVISRCGIGIDSIDMRAANDMGIIVSNTPDAPTISVAELTLGMILSLLRGIHISDANVRKGIWARPMGNLLHKKTVGIIGCGRIGSCLSRLLLPFGCIILGHDTADIQGDIFIPASLDELISKSDIISIHIHYDNENRHFFNRELIRMMKKGALLVNSARGGLVDESALYDALVSGHLGGAALDCFENEPYKGGLKDLDNVLLTPHIGSYAKEGRVMMENQALDNLFAELEKAGVIS